MAVHIVPSVKNNGESMETRSKFIKMNNTEEKSFDRNGNPLNGSYFYAEDFNQGKKTILRFIDGYLNGDIIDKNGNIVLQKPAVETEGHIEYWRKNKIHRDDGKPAVITDGFNIEEFWENGIRLN